MTVSERITRTALLGVRFWDRVSARPVADGLELVETTSGTVATYGPHGVFAFHDLPGLRESANGVGDDAFWSSPPTRAAFTFRVRDRERRFLPFTFDANVPARGLFAEDCGLAPSPPEIVGIVPLFSAPSRVAPGAIARVSADLWDVEADRPAAWAVLEVSADPSAPPYRGVADERGRVVVLFAYPEPPLHAASPPPPPGSRALANQTWPLTLAVRYAPAAMSPPAPDPASGEPPDLCAVLTQPVATLLAADSPATPLGPQLLAFGRELPLRTPGHSELHVLPA